MSFQCSLELLLQAFVVTQPQPFSTSETESIAYMESIEIYWICLDQKAAHFSLFLTLGASPAPPVIQLTVGVRKWLASRAFRGDCVLFFFYEQT